MRYLVPQTKTAYHAVMATRGPYAKGVVKRAQILDKALEVIVREGYSGATVKQLADAVGLSQNGLLHYFGSKDALYVEILRHHAEVLAIQVDSEHADFSYNFAQRSTEALWASVREPGISQLLLSLATEATEEGHIAHAEIERRYASFREVASTALSAMQERGEFPSDADPAIAAALLAAAFDGLQLQWLYDKTIDVRGAFAYLLRHLGVSDQGVEPAQSEGGPRLRESIRPASGLPPYDRATSSSSA